VPDEMRLKISALLKQGSQILADKWTREITSCYKSSGASANDLTQKSKVGIEILANILEGASISSYDNFIRKLALEWIAQGGTVDELRNLKKSFIRICEEYFSSRIIPEETERFAKHLDNFMENEIWPYAATIYLEIYESEVYEKLRNLPDSNAALRRLLKLTARLGSITDAGDVWDEFLQELREIFPSVDAAAVFLFVESKLALKGIIGFEDFIIIKNSSDMDFDLYEKLVRRPGVTITSSSNLDEPFRIVFYKRLVKGERVNKEFPRYMLTFQLVANDTLKGLVALYGFEKKVFFDDDELDLLEILIANLKSALARADTFEDLKRRRRDGEALIDIERHITGHTDPQILASSFLSSVSDYLGDIRSAIYIVGSSPDELIPLGWHETLEKPGQSKLSPIYTFALERKAPIFLSSLKDNPILEGIAPPSEIVDPDEQGALGVIPLLVGDEIIGLWSISTPKNPELVEGRRFFLALASSSLAYNLKNILTYINMREEHTRRGKEIHLAASLQQNLVPRYFRGLGYEIEVTLEAGGDLAGDFAFLDVSSGKELFLAIGDVSGRGIAAGMSMMSTYGLMGELVKTAKSPALILERLNNRLREQYDKTPPPFHDEAFVTCFLISADTDGSIRYSKAGHLPPILFRRASESDESMDAHGMPLGIFADSLFEEHERFLSPGDILVLYTDGITEARDENGDEFGVSRLRELIKRWHAYPPRIIRNMIGYNLSRFVPSGSRGDDRTWIVISREMDGWLEFVIPSDDGKVKIIKEITNIIGKTSIGKQSAVFSYVLNESLASANKRGQTGLKLRIFANDEKLHLVLNDTDPVLKGLDYPGVGSSTAPVFPESRKALAILRSEIDFIWHNQNTQELNIFKSLQKDELE